MRSISAIAVILSTGLALAAGACRPAQNTPDADWPSGALLSARTEVLRSVFTELGHQATTPIGRTARTWLAHLPDCPEVEATVASGEISEFPTHLRCSNPAASPDGLRGWRGDADIALAWPVGDGPRLRLRGTQMGGDLQLSLAWPRAPIEGLLGSLLPGERPAGQPVLSQKNPVIHARVRGAGHIDVSALAPEGSQGDQLFQLRSELFGAAVLDGSWEVAVYPPGNDQDMPQAALALGVGLESLADRALDQFIGELEQTWQLKRTAVDFQVGLGSCLPELRLLPDFAPCAITTRNSVIVAWNAESLRSALSDSPQSEVSTTSGRIAIDLERLHQADEALALGSASDSAIPVIDWPWRRVIIEGSRAADRLDLAIVFQGERTGS